MRNPIRGSGLAVLLAMILLVAICGSPAARASEGFSLDAVRERVMREHPSLSHLTTAELAETARRDDDVLIFDVREWEEYAVSRIPGAIRVDPDTWTHSFMQQFGDRVLGKTVVFYCAVGVRSSELAEQVRDEIVQAGAVAVHNLDGGIFAWHNEERPLENDSGPTKFVHPFDSYWGQLVERTDLVRTQPE